MILPDVNILVYAFRREAQLHARYSAWLAAVVAGADELALHDTVLTGAVRLVTNPRIFADPAPMPMALDFVARLRAAQRARWLPSSDAVWTELERLVGQDRGLRGSLVPDALLAALARTHGCQIATADRGFARFPDVRFFDPAA
ncbi:MAG TPA: TA system VapC family ribonuclease toxin [Pseudonocardiaceae bacterium]|nr:TA system VapC family ribonuclease toxin [Pseudonocardiaceae bacterium]